MESPGCFAHRDSLSNFLCRVLHSPSITTFSRENTGFLTEVIEKDFEKICKEII